jgi:hypothetical protein
MKMNTFELEQKLHALNKSLLEKNSEVCIEFRETPERCYESRFTFEFAEDVKQLIDESKDIVIAIEYEHSWRGSLQSDYIITNYDQDWDLLWKQLTFDGARPTVYYVFYASDNPLDHEILYKMIKAAGTVGETDSMLPHNRLARPIEHFPFFPKNS